MDKDDKEEMKKVFSTCRNKMSMIEDGKDRRDRKLRYADLGLCGKCINLHAETTQYGTRRHWCTELHRKLYPNDPLIDCTNYVEAGGLSLPLMLGMAIHIDPKKSRKIGFMVDDEDEWQVEHYL